MVVQLQEARCASVDGVKELQRSGRRGNSRGSCWSDCDPVAGRAPKSSTTEGGARAKATALEQAGRREGCTSSSR
jgi:hypothetical protein